MRETEKNERIAELERVNANLLAEVHRLEKLIAELERIAAHRLDELVDLRARVLELEPLAGAGCRRSDIVICPWCDCQYTDPSHDFPRSGDERCGRCGGRFRVDIEYSVTYTTSKIEKAETP